MLLEPQQCRNHDCEASRHAEEDRKYISEVSPRVLTKQFMFFLAQVQLSCNRLECSSLRYGLLLSTIIVELCWTTQHDGMCENQNKERNGSYANWRRGREGRGHAQSQMGAQQSAASYTARTMGSGGDGSSGKGWLPVMVGDRVNWKRNVTRRCLETWRWWLKSTYMCTKFMWLSSGRDS